MNKNCSICQTSILDGEAVKVCDKCNIEYHSECWEENTGCATYGCPNTPAPSTKDNTMDNIGQADLTKTCPVCKEEIDYYDDRCRQCGSLTQTEQEHNPEREKVTIGEYKPGILIIIFAVLGITAPFALVFGGIWYMQNKEMINEKNPLLKFLSLLGLSIAAFYVLLLFIMII